MSVPLAIPTDEGYEKTRPGFLFPVQKSERSPAGSVDERVFGQIAGWVEAAITSSSLRLPGFRRGMRLKMLSCRGVGKQRSDSGRRSLQASCQNRKHIVIVDQSGLTKTGITALQSLLRMLRCRQIPAGMPEFLPGYSRRAVSRSADADIERPFGP